MSKTRYLEVDILRTVAIVMMIVHHIVFDMWYLQYSNVHPFTGFWWYWQKSTLSLFLLLVGFSFAIYSRKLGPGALQLKQLKRFTHLGVVALAITVVSFVIVPQAPIYFGVIHCIAVSMLFLPLAKQASGSIAMIIVIGFGTLLSKALLPTSTNVLAPFGLYNSGFASTDYVPLIPWLAIIVAGNLLALCTLPFLHRMVVPRWLHVLTWPGRHSLLVYIVHQPVVLLILYLIFT